MEEQRVLLTFSSHLLTVQRRLWNLMVRSLTGVLSDLISHLQAEVDQVVAAALVVAVASVVTEVAAAALVAVVASVATEVAVAASVVAVASVAVVALVTEVAEEVAVDSTPLTRASLFHLRTNL
jgi:hypothetical protein